MKNFTELLDSALESVWKAEGMYWKESAEPERQKLLDYVTAFLPDIETLEGLLEKRKRVIYVWGTGCRFGEHWFFKLRRAEFEKYDTYCEALGDIGMEDSKFGMNSEDILTGFLNFDIKHVEWED